tara:strand:- start:834 stop:1112 length:279 start_codon:yes stop_codon:yes gene_type:complete
MSESNDDEWCFYSGMPSPKAYEIEPLSKELLLERGHCCDNGCKNCPYKEQSQVSTDEWVDSDNDEYDGYSSKANDGEVYDGESGYDDEYDDC